MVLYLVSIRSSWPRTLPSSLPNSLGLSLNSSMSNLDMIFASDSSIWLDWSIWPMFMLRSTTSDALEISSTVRAPKVTMVVMSLMSIWLVSRSISSESTSWATVLSRSSMTS